MSSLSRHDWQKQMQSTATDSLSHSIQHSKNFLFKKKGKKVALLSLLSRFSSCSFLSCLLLMIRFGKTRIPRLIKLANRKKRPPAARIRLTHALARRDCSDACVCWERHGWDWSRCGDPPRGSCKLQVASSPSHTASVACRHVPGLGLGHE